MVTLATRIDEIFEIEGFKVQVLDEGGGLVLPSAHGVLDFKFKKMMPNKNTVSDWRARRFNSKFGDYDCRVLQGNGKTAKDGMTLEAVRESYV